MVQKASNKMQLFFLLMFAPLTLAGYNVFRPRYLEPSENYYSQEEMSQGYYQNDDMVKCPILHNNPADIGADIDSGFYKGVYSVYSSNNVIMYLSEEEFSPGGAALSSQYHLKIRQKVEVEPPTICPVIEVEIQVHLQDMDTKICYLMWDELLEYSYTIPGYHPKGFTFIHTKCTDMGDPEEDNPKKIFTLIPYIESECDMRDYLGCLRYKMCPSQKTSCKAPALAVSGLGGNPRFGMQAPNGARTYNLGNTLFKRQAYYEYLDSPLDSYQNDDACPSSMTGILSFDLNGKRCLFAYVFENSVIMLPEYEKVGGVCNHFVQTFFQVEVRQMYDPEPPNPCPIIEAEITFHTVLTDVKCALLWDSSDFRGNAYQDFIHPVCTAIGNPDSSGENNPKRIFTLIPQPGTSIVDRKELIGYKLCAGMNKSCEEMVVTATQLEWLSDVRVNSKIYT